MPEEVLNMPVILVISAKGRQSSLWISLWKVLFLCLQRWIKSSNFQNLWLNQAFGKSACQLPLANTFKEGLNTTCLFQQGFALKARIQLILESVLMMTLPLSWFKVLQSNPFCKSTQLLTISSFLSKTLQRMLNILQRFYYLAWFSIERIKGQWFLYFLQNQPIILMVYSKSIGLQKDLSLKAWVMMGLCPSLCTSISTHFKPLSRSSRYLYILESLVS